MSDVIGEADGGLPRTVVELLARLSDRNFDIGELLTDDAVFEVPYAGVKAEGREAFLEMFVHAMANLFDALRLEITEAYPGRDPGVLVVEYRSEGRMAGTGRAYANQYAGIFRGVNGRISLWREYFNPEVFHAATEEAS